MVTLVFIVQKVKKAVKIDQLIQEKNQLNFIEGVLHFVTVCFKPLQKTEIGIADGN